MTKYSTDFKQRVLRYRERNCVGTKTTAIKFEVEQSAVRKWLFAYKQPGIAGLKRQTGQYLVPFKLQVLETMTEEHWSLRQTYAFFNIPASSTVST